MNLTSSVAEIPSVGPAYQKRLEKLKIKTVEDLLLHVPYRYLDFRRISKINQVRVGETVTLQGKVLSLKNIYTKSWKKLQLAGLTDQTGEIKIVWFNQPFLLKNISVGENLSVAGKISLFRREKALVSPEYEKIADGQALIHTARLVPIYSETSGISSRWLRVKIKTAYDLICQQISEFLPETVLVSSNLSGLKEAIRFVHFPENFNEAEKGRERLAFNELLLLQAKNLARKILWQKNKPAYKLRFKNSVIKEFIDSLPFKLTASQKKSVNEILNDLKKNYPMNRLLEGDVGSGKTVVAVVGAFVSFLNGCQSVFMAPTQILAEQHFKTLNLLLQPFKVRIKLVTADLKKGDLGRSDIFVGTQSLIYNKVNFEKVAFVVIDEQHRFGVEQRTKLIKKAEANYLAPHVLTMTATPIPRTVALTLYGDLDLSTLTELPKGRQKITTWIVPPQKREAAYKWIEEQIIREKIQVYIVCPLIEESYLETMKEVRAVTKEFEQIKSIFNKHQLGLLHGRLKAPEKAEVLEKFRAGKIDILVSTPVVEVGIDVPNATIMMVEAAERFGLAELHQLRGRVGRGEKKSYCLLFSTTKSPKALARLSALQKSISGFELAELDLKLRGPGEIYGLKQHGFPELKIASWNDVQLIKKAKKIAEKAFADPEKYKLLHQKLAQIPTSPN